MSRQILNVIRSMRAKGSDCAAILDAVEAIAETSTDAIEDRRASDRVRKARQRAALKDNGKRHVTSADVTGQSEPKPKSTTGTRLPADWVLDREWISEALNAQPNNQPKLTEAEIRHEADKFRDYWHGQPGAKGRKLDWLGTWRNWIRRASPEILRARSRANGSANAGRANGAPQFAPKLTQFDAFAIAGAEAGMARGGAGRSPAFDDAPRPAIGFAGPEVIDLTDARGTGARKPGGDSGDDGPSLFPLPIAASR